MSCLDRCYLPIPPRIWSRQGSPCVYPSPNGAGADAGALLQYNKGNILQYKKNDANMSKQQKYAQIAKGIWKPRHVSWACQPQDPLWTNPNTNAMKRVRYKKIYLATGASAPLDASLTCLADYHTIPYNQIVIADGGNLVCGTLENICTGEVLENPIQPIVCNPSTHSDVPGPIVSLCWNDGLATWYPRTRTIMGSGGNKFPEGYKGFVSAIQPNCIRNPNN